MYHQIRITAIAFVWSLWAIRFHWEQQDDDDDDDDDDD